MYKIVMFTLTFKIPYYLLFTCGLIFCSFLTPGKGQDDTLISIVCHECWPYMEDFSCAELDSNATLYNCTNYGIWDVNVTCFSAFINLTAAGSPASSTGVYRGCAMRHIDYTDYCEFYKNYVSSQGIDIVSCAECYEDGCNTHRFTEDGYLVPDDTGNNSPNIIKISLPLILLLVTMTIMIDMYKTL